MPKVTHWPPSPTMQEIQGTRLATVRRRIQAGPTNTLGEKFWAWQQVAVLDAIVITQVAHLKMTPPGLAEFVTHEMLTHFRLDPRDGGFIVRARDIITDDAGRTYLVEYSIDEGDAHVYLAVGLRQGAANDLQGIAEQG